MTRTIDSSALSSVEASNVDSSATSTIETAPVDAVGRLMHAEDAMAQACLAFVRLESALADRSLKPEAITAIRLRVIAAPMVSDLVDAVREHLVERLGDRAASVPIAVAPVVRFADPDMLVTLQADVLPAASPATLEPPTAPPKPNHQ